MKLPPDFPRDASAATASTPALDPVRVIVVGRTALSGIDSVLRRDRSVELIRARTALAAIGEAACPIDHDSPSDLTVIASPEAVPAGRSAAFAAAIRTVDAHARLLNLGERPLEGFDAAIAASTDAGGLVVHVRHRATPAAAPASVPSQPPATVTPLPAPEAPSETIPAPDDLDPAAALATGRDPVLAALNALKRRWNLTDARIADDGDKGLACLLYTSPSPRD